MKALKVITIGVLLSSLASCGGGGGEGVSTSKGGNSSVPSGISQTAQLEKQYREKAKELIERQESYELFYEMMTPERRLIVAKRFEEGKKQLNSLQKQINALKNAEKISFLSTEEVEHRYKDRINEVLIVKNDKSLIQTHIDLINLSEESLKQIEEKSIERFNPQTGRENKKLKVYETDSFVYVQKV